MIERPPLSDIVEITSRISGISVFQLTGQQRAQKLARARFAGFAVAQEYGYSAPKIARAFGRQDHTTVLHGIKRVAELPDVARMSQQIAAKLRGLRHRRRFPSDFHKHVRVEGRIRTRIAREKAEAVEEWRKREWAKSDARSRRAEAAQWHIPPTIAGEYQPAWADNAEVARRRADYLALRG